jgi:Outer membrane protein beta-barrel domain
MNHRLKALAVAGAIIAAVSSAPVSVAAQSSFDFTIIGGISAPVADLSDGWDVGPNLGAAASFWLNDNFAVRVDGSVDLLSGKDISPNRTVPDLTLYHIGGGLEYSVTDRATSNLNVNLNAGLGLTRMQSDNIGASSLSADFGENYFHLNGGAEVGYRISDQVHLGIQGQAYITLADDADTTFFQDFIPGLGITNFSSAITLPITATIRIML